MFSNAFHLELNKIKLDCVMPAPSAFKELILTFRDVARAWIVLCPGGGGTPHMRGVRMLDGNFELNP